MSRWIHTSEKLPNKNGRYWVYPYRTLSGHFVVTLASFTDGDWEERINSQNYTFWQPLDIPNPPKSAKLPR
jgi:Protein of unknown function (DUF551)